MAVRFYVGDRLGDGLDVPYYSAVERWVLQNLGIRCDGHRQIISHCIAITIERYDLTTAQHNALLAALPTVQAFAATLLPAQVSSLTTAQQNAIRNRLDSVGFDSSWVVGTTTIRQILKAVADSVQLCEKVSVLINQPLQIAVFNVGNKTVGDLSVAQRIKLLDLLAVLGVTATGTLATPLQEVVDLIRFAIKDFE